VTDLFYLAAAITLLTTGLAISRANPVHALVFFVISLLAVGVVFYTLGAPFAAALEVIIYAGAIMVMFLFVVMMLNLGRESIRRERASLRRPLWVLPLCLALMLGGEVLVVVHYGHGGGGRERVVPPEEVGLRLFTSDLAAVELASMLLLAGLVGAYHLGRPEKSRQ
jgi:NADH-quinone oxidoreductase subunit J